MSAPVQLGLLDGAPRPAVAQARLPETHVNGAVAPLTHEVTCILSDARSMTYQNAVQAALKVIPLIRAADVKSGVRS